MDTFTHNGREYAVTIDAEDSPDAPWENSDGHGSVRKSLVPHSRHESGKHPGERPLNRASGHDYQFYYDWAGAMKTARSDGWGLSESAVQTFIRDNKREPTRGEYVQLAVQSDFDYLRRYLDDQWRYVWVRLTLGDHEASLGYVEYDDTESSIADTLAELASEIEVSIAESDAAARSRICEIRRLHHLFWRGLSGDKGSADVAQLALERVRQLRAECSELIESIRSYGVQA
jgi:hypothetical protein